MISTQRNNLTDDHTGICNNRNFRGSSSYIDDHRTSGFDDGNAESQSVCHRTLYQKNLTFPKTSSLCYRVICPFFNLRHIHRNCKINNRMASGASGSSLQKCLKENLQMTDIGNHAVGHRGGNLHICRRFFIHFISFISHSQYLFFVANSNHISFF